MSRRRAVVLAIVSAVALVLHAILVRAMAHGHVAHVLLGAGSSMPAIGAALLAVALVLVRLFAIVVVPGLLLASIVSLVAHWGTISGAGTSVGGGAGTSIGVRGTK
jgi:hypothetical protein